MATLQKSKQSSTGGRAPVESGSFWFRHTFRGSWFPMLCLLVATVFVYMPAWHAGFIWDDDAYVVNNSLLTARDGLKRIWFSLESPSQYFPLAYTTLRVEHAWWGLNPTGYHLFNIMLHAANALLVWQLLRRLAVKPAWLIAALFALHPVPVESVAWITELKNLQSVFFCLLALLAWVSFSESSGRRAWMAYGLTLLFYILALCSKTTACTLPMALFLVWWWRRIPVSMSRLALLAPFILLGFGMGLLAMWWERFHQGTYGETFAISPMVRVLIASRAVWFYLGKLVWPANLTFSYPRWSIHPSDGSAYIWLAAGAAVCASVVLLRRRFGRGIECAGLFFVASLSPCLGFIMLYTFRYSFVADHYQYFACLGPLALAGSALGSVLARSETKKPLLKPVIYGVLLASLAVLTMRQSATYKSAKTLWTTTLERNPGSLLAQNNLGLIILHEGHPAEAALHFQRALELDPNFIDARIDLGHALLDLGRIDDAVACYRDVVKVLPDFPNASSNLGRALMRKGDVQEAVMWLERSVQMQPTNASFLDYLAWVRATNAKVHDAAEAVRLAEHACRATDYQQPLYLRTLAAAYAEAGRFEEALAATEKFRELAEATHNPEFAQQCEREVREMVKFISAKQPVRAPW